MQDLDLKQKLFIRVLFNHYPAADFNALIKCLPPEQAKAIAQENISLNNPSVAFLQPIDLLGNIHYSWIGNAIKTKPSALQAFIIASLNEQQKEQLSKFLKLRETLEKPALPLKKYLCHQLYYELGMQKLLPISFLPPSPFSRLLKFSKVKLVEVLDFLGLYDLAEEIRGIVDTKNLKNIYTCLTGKKQQFLRICLHQKEKVSFPRLQLEKWDGNCQELNKLIHRRGIIRLAKALSGQHQDFIWYLTHMLDIGRGNLLLKEIESAEIPGVTQALSGQIVSLINFLEQGAA